jgi:hypothetical protein
MEFQRLNDILNRAKIVHTAERLRIDFSSENLRYAIYLLQGGALTCVTTAYKFNLSGYQVPTTQQKRMIDEIVDLIVFFEELGEGSRQLKAWFAGKAVERSPDAISVKDRALKNLVSEDVIKEIQSKTNELNHIISVRGMHPSITAVRANSTKTTHIFRYDHEGVPPYYKPGDFGTMFVNPALYTLLLPLRLGLINQEVFDELSAYKKEIDLE